jgi:hypothetical protein
MPRSPTVSISTSFLLARIGFDVVYVSRTNQPVRASDWPCRGPSRHASEKRAEGWSRSGPRGGWDGQRHGGQGVAGLRVRWRGAETFKFSTTAGFGRASIATGRDRPQVEGTGAVARSNDDATTRVHFSITQGGPVVWMSHKAYRLLMYRSTSGKAPLRPRHESKGPSWLSFFCGFLMAAFLLGIILPSAAAAHPVKGCVNTEVNVEGAEGGMSDAQDGIKGDVWFGTWNSQNNGGDCMRVSSIAVLASGGGYGVVEWGWVLGFHPKFGNVYTGSDACDGGYFTGPESFVVWVPVGGAYHCRDLFASAGDNFFPLSLKDTNTDTVFNAYKSGTLVATMDVNFSIGNVVTNGERHNLNIDTAFSEFKNLQKQVGGLSTWSDFCCSYRWRDDDPGFYWNKITDTHTKVSPN